MITIDDCDEPEIVAEDLLDTQDCETVCTICNAEFLDPQDLQQHSSQIHSSLLNLVQCHFCTSTLSDLEKYALHIRDYHIKSLKSCMYCTKIFVDYDQHRKHERRHYCAKRNHNSCSQCSKSFVSTAELERHEYENHNNEKDGFIMRDIFPILSSVLNMRAVDFIQSMNSKSACQCGYCGYKSTNATQYIAHLQNESCQSRSCDNCSYTHKYKRNLIRHFGTHKECFIFVRDKKCTKCHEKISSPFYYNHIKQCKPIKCSSCDIVFFSLDELSEHQSKMHPLAVEVKLCKFCSRQCVGDDSLTKHMVRVHKNELQLYKYKCVTCETPFKHPQKLFAHYFIKHKDLEPYTCQICDKKFRIRKRFTIHIKLDHKSVGFVEFDENYHVFFTEKRPEIPFVPHCVLPEDELRMFINEKEIKVEKQQKVEPNTEQSDKLYLEILNQTETEGNITEVEIGPRKKVLKRRRELPRHISTKKVKKDEVVPINSSDEEDVPLLSLKKRKPKTGKIPFKSLWDRKKKSVKDNRQQLTCKICDKYCYTFQNHQHHMSLHGKNDIKTCIKCSRDFRSKEKLNKHIETEHSTSKLTETLKSLLEKRKKCLKTSNTPMTLSERFQQTIKKTKTDSVTAAATITPIDNGLSVQKYLETFTPEGETTKPQNVVIENCVSIRTITDPFYRKSVINMTKFEPKHEVNECPALTLPVRFKSDDKEKVKVNVKLVQSDDVYFNAQNDFLEDNYEHFYISDKGDTVPEVAQEVMLEGFDEPPRQIQVPSKIILPKLPKGCNNISIAHLQSEAPFYKIVKVNQIAKEPEKIEEHQRKDLIKLPDGTKLVTVNPLAHLLGDKKVDEILQPLKNKYYKPKITKNVTNLLTKAMEKANTPTNLRKRKLAKAKKLNAELANQNSSVP